MPVSDRGDTRVADADGMVCQSAAPTGLCWSVIVRNYVTAEGLELVHHHLGRTCGTSDELGRAGIYVLVDQLLDAFRSAVPNAEKPS